MRAWIAAVLLLVLAGCGDEATETKSSQYVFGTLVEITVRGVPKDRADAAFVELAEGFRRMHVDWHARNNFV